jgi:hypothetical protein
MAVRIANEPDSDQRAKRIAAMIEQGFIEGAYRHFLDHKDKIAELEAERDALKQDIERHIANHAADLSANGAEPVNDGEQAMQDAAANLPERYDLRIYLERGAGWVELYDPDGKPVEFDEDTDDGMTGRIRAATAAAIAASAEKGDKA